MDGKFNPEDVIRNRFNLMVSQMSETEKEAKIKEYGNMENYYQAIRESFFNDMQPMSATDRFIQTIPYGIIEKMAAKKDFGPAFYKIKKIVREYESSAGQMFPNEKNISRLLLEQAKFIRENPSFTQITDEKYGQGMCNFFVQAIEAYYQS